ncbi:hypothetical protein Tcan_10829 [Toxocara canis]|uniref:Uncharacterized protein n=1 Tax=Toxocara canis TaxID=6265 RepID=A0A0B2UX31_TOXCA|nr:hypothetical protein Tcan_10829 [Toxocara canis]
MLGVSTQMGIIIDIKNALEFTNVVEVPATTTAFLILDNIHYKLLIPSVILTVMDAAAIILGSCVCYKNKKIYKHAFKSGTHELTARYQTAENIRTTRLIAPVLAIQFVSKILVVGIFYFVLVFANDNSHEFTEMFCRIGAIIVAFFIAIWPWLIILRYPPYRNRMKKHKTTPECFDPCTIKNVNGMRIAKNQCANEHFQQLNKFWNLDPSPTVLHQR